MFDLKDLEAFTAVCDTCSLTGSARRLNLPKSTLSRRIRQLESSLGQTLLRRESNRLIPTEAGQMFNRYCQQILRLASDGQAALEELDTEVSGCVRVSCHEALMRSWMSPLVLNFLSAYPGVEVRLETQSEAPFHAETDSLCLWLGQEQEPAGGLRCERLGLMRRGLYADPDYLARVGQPQHPRELACCPHIGLERDGDFDLWHEEEGSYRAKALGARLKVDQLGLQMDALRNGGVALLPHWQVDARLRHHPGTLERCLPQWQGEALGVYLLYPYGPLPRRTRVFLQTVRKAVPAAWKVQ